ncbi:MAG TPA: TonB family protein [Anaeromyxobacter sp.]|nr:TonB family protein [Anaeromyxobacter sp.]
MPVLLALLGAGALPVHAKADDTPPGQLTRAPVLLAPAEPEYPAQARAEGLAGQVTLEIEISETGEVQDAVVTRSAGHGFDEAALAAARRLRFSPAEIDGKPAAVRIEYRYDFTLRPAPAQAQSPAAPAEGAPPPANLRGRVREMGTRLPVVAALVQAGGKSAYTDREGQFALSVPLGEVKVVVTDAAHARYEVAETVLEGTVTEVTYWLLRTALSANETVVTGMREEREVSQQAITAGEIQRIAGVSGDAVKVIQNLPGVARAPFGSGQLVVRGGNPRDTRVYVDGLPVPEIFHFGGVTSIYSSELVKEVEFEPGNWGVSSGRAIGGRVNLVTRDPGDRLHALADVNLYQGTVLAEGHPSDDLGLAFAARRSYADFVIRQAVKRMDNPPGLTVAPQFYDLQAKAAWKPAASDTVRLDFFGSYDRMAFTNVDTKGLVNLDELKYGNQFYDGNLRWEHRTSEDTRFDLSLGGGWQRVVAQVGEYFTETDDIFSSIFRAELRHRIGPALELRTGVDGQWDPRAQVSVQAGSLEVPGQISPDTQVLQEPNRFDRTLDGYEAGAFVEAAVEPFSRLRIVPGVRADVHRSVKTLCWVDPRLSARLEIDKATALKGGVGLYHQAPPIPYMTAQWGNPALLPEGAWQYSLGVERKLLPRTLPQLSLDLEGYYKQLFHLALPTSDTVVRDGQQVPEHFVSAGSGEAYGLELLVRWDPDGRFFGWVAYSLSRTRRDQSVSGGRLEREGNAYDQPNNLVAVGTFELPELWTGLSSGFRLRYTTGNPYERVRTAVYDADGDRYQPLTTGNLDSRMPDFFQLDLRVDKKWTYRLWSQSVYLEVQNVTNRRNPEAPAYNFDYSKQGWVTGIGFFPAFGYRAEY